MKLLPTKSAIKHSRFAFSFFLLPVYVFALSQSAEINTVNAVLVFIIWHFLIYPASNGFNSYFDKDEGSIALLKNPPPTDKTLYFFSLTLDVVGILLGMLVSLEFAAATFIYGLLSKLYSHPAVRLKKYPVISFLVVFVFQGAFVYYTTYLAIANISIFHLEDEGVFLASLISSCLVGASYPLTQVYQHEEDSRRGDKTLSIILGIRGSFIFAAALFAAAGILMFYYWKLQNQPDNFWIFLLFILPVLWVFVNWFHKVWKRDSEANFKNMSRMTFISGFMMLCYFIFILWR